MTTSMWWYPTSYALFLIFFPYVSKGLECLERKEVWLLFASMFFLWSVISIVPVKLSLGGENETMGFIMLYVFIYYVRKFEPKWASTPKFYKSLALVGMLIAFASIFVMDMLSYKSGMINQFACYYIRGNSRLLPVIISIGLFLWFTKIKIESKFVNWIGGLTFAVYLIHMHPVMCDWLFKDIFSLQPYIGHWSIVAFVFLTTLFIFTCCVIIEQMRKWLFMIPSLIKKI